MHSNRFHRLRVKNLHNCKSKKSRIDLWGVKLQHKVRSIFVRDEIFENIRRTQRIDKGKHKGCYASLCKSFVFDWNFRKFRPEQKCLGLYVVTLRILYRFLIFWTQNYVDFSRGGAWTGYNWRFCTHKELNVFCTTCGHSAAKSTDRAFHLRRLAHVPKTLLY